TAVSNRVSRRQANRWASQEQQQYEQAPPPQYQQAPPQYQQAPPEPAEDPIAQLRELAKLRDDGILTDEEFAAEKHKILG
ncbi:MAG TPA: SHOCT domain-containing protein, partial [Solirubrobacter sp.]